MDLRHGDTLTDFGDMSLRDGYAYVADGVGLLVVDIEDPTQTRIAGSVDPARYSNGVALASDAVLLLSNEDLHTLPLHCSGVTQTPSDPPALARATLSAHPNPFNPTGSFVIDMPTAALGSLRIYDASGRHVRTLFQRRQLTAGAQEAFWNGRDERGRSVTSGIYFARLAAGGAVVAEKVVLLK
jgi:hypothetical protein